MIRLSLPTDPYWVDLPHGVKVLIRPVDTASESAAHFEAIARLQETPLGEASKGAHHGAAKSAVVTAAAQHAILQWTGVLTADGAEAPVTPENIARLMAIPVAANAFAEVWYEPLGRVVAEGEGCGVAPAGTGAAAPGTVEGVETTA